jgi:hypothetical protein
MTRLSAETSITIVPVIVLPLTFAAQVNFIRLEPSALAVLRCRHPEFVDPDTPASSVPIPAWFKQMCSVLGIV